VSKPPPRTALNAAYPLLRRSFTRDELFALMPDRPLKVLDIGAGINPVRVRPQDELTTADFAGKTKPDVVVDVAAEWPFPEDAFDLVYMSHVVEHFYPADRDEVIRRVHRALRPGGHLFIRVPHWSGFQGYGWEHHTQYAINSGISLATGENPQLPVFEPIAAGYARTIHFDRERARVSLLERALNARWRLTEGLLCRLVGGIAEVQFLFRKPNPVREGQQS
jgi:SAM-dependent methyltransferase